MLKSKMKKLAKRISRGPLNSALADFTRTIPAGSRVLNIGSGGEVMDVIYRNLHPQSKVFSTDIDPERNPDFVDDITDSKLEPMSFDYLICAEVLEHVTEPFKASDNIHKVLKPGGEAFISTPFLYPLHDAPHDYFRYTEFGLANLFKNFKSVEIKPRDTWANAILLLILRSLRFKRKPIDVAVHVIMFWNLPLLLLLWPVLRETKTSFLTSGFVCRLKK